MKIIKMECVRINVDSFHNYGFYSYQVFYAIATDVMISYHLTTFKNYEHPLVSEW